VEARKGRGWAPERATRACVNPARAPHHLLCCRMWLLLQRHQACCLRRGVVSSTRSGRRHHHRQHPKAAPAYWRQRFPATAAFVGVAVARTREPARCLSSAAAAAAVQQGRSSQSSHGGLSFARRHVSMIYNFGMASSFLAFVATDILHLRCLSVLGTSCAIWFNYTRAPPWNAVCWGICFVSINMAQIVRLIVERQQGVTLSAKELELYHKHFAIHSLSPEGFRRLMDICTCRLDLPDGTVLVQQGEVTRTIMLVHCGTVNCVVSEPPQPGADDAVTSAATSRIVDVVTSGELSWLAELSFLANTEISEAGSDSSAATQKACLARRALASCITAPSSEAVGTTAPWALLAGNRGVSVATWRVDDLVALLESDPAIALAVRMSLAATVAGKLRRKLRREAAGIDAPNATATLASEATHYEQLLQVALCGGIVHPKAKRLLQDHRAQRSVTAEQHTAALQRVGWSGREFEDGALLVGGGAS
jgi:hypothetical protein